jgi:hypothetical protein
MKLVTAIYCQVWRVCMTNKTGSGLDDWIYWQFDYNYNQLYQLTVNGCQHSLHSLLDCEYVRVIELPSPQQRLLGLYLWSTLLHYYMFRRSLCCGDGNSITLTHCNTQQDAHREDALRVFSLLCDFVLISESVTSSASVVRWLTLHRWTLNFWILLRRNHWNPLRMPNDWTLLK